MEYNIRLKIEENNGSFYILSDKNEIIASLDFNIDDNIINSYHTGVNKELEGKGIAKQLFNKLIEFARENKYKINPLCSYIEINLRRRPEEFADVYTPS